MFKTFRFIIIIPAIAVLCGCAISGGNPVASGLSGNDSLAGGSLAADSGAGNVRDVWGLYEISIDTQEGTVEAVPMRAAMFRCNMNRNMEINGPKHLKFANLDLSHFAGEGLLTIDVGLQHPFPGLDKFTGFDVWGVFMHNGSGLLTYDNLNYPVAGVDGILLNADGYTRWFNKPEFTAPYIAGYTPGVAGSKNFEPGARLNGYKIFGDGIGKGDDVFTFLSAPEYFANRLMFRAGNTNWRTYQLRFPIVGGSPVLKFQYAVHASWALSDPPTPLNVPEDFPLTANIQESNYIRCTVTEAPWFEDGQNWGGGLGLDIDIFDWQGAYTNPGGIAGEIAGIKVAGNFIPATYVGVLGIINGTEQYSTVHVDIAESYLAPTGSTGNEIWIVIESLDPSDYADDGLIPPGKYPDAALAAFARVPVTFGSSPTNLPPDVGQIVGENNPTVNVAEIYSLTYATDPESQPLTITWENDGDDDFADDTDGNTINLDGTLIFASSGAATVKAKVSDGVNEVIRNYSVMVESCAPNGMVDITPKGWPADMNDVWVDGNTAYTVCGSGGLVVLDVSGTGDPVYIGGHDMAGQGNEVQIDGDYCYVADGAAGVQIFDVSDPTEPVFAGSYVGTDAYGLHVVDNLCYLADGKGGLVILDVGGGTQGGSPTNPKVEGQIGMSYAATDVYVSKGIACVLDLETAFRTVDVGGGTMGGSPSNPKLEGELTSVTGGDAVVVSGDHAYVGHNPSSNGSLRTIFIKDPSAPSLENTINTPSSVYDLWIDSGKLYAVLYSEGLYIYGLADPSKPAFTTSYDTPGHGFGVCKSGNFGYVADYEYGLQKIDVTVTPPVFIGNFKTPLFGFDIDFVGDYVYMAASYLGMDVVSVGGVGGGTPELPLQVARWDDPPGGRGIDIEGGYAYLGCGWLNPGDLYIADIGAVSGAPDNPITMGQISSFYTYGLQKVDSYVYAASYESGLKIYDVDGGVLGGSPSNPKLVTTFSTGTAWDIWMEDGYAYVANGGYYGFSGLKVIDVGGGTGSPSSPILADDYSVNQGYLHMYDVNVLNGYAYCVGGNVPTWSLWVFDVGASTGAPNDIQLATKFTIPSVTSIPRGLTLSCGYAYIVTEAGQIVCVDVGGGAAGGSPTDPKFVEQIDLPGDANAVAVDGKYAYVATINAGLRVVKLW